MATARTFSDITDHYEFVGDKLVYIDAPLEGILKASAGSFFAFRCTAIIQDHLWHWTLIPVDGPNADVASAFSLFGGLPATWISIVEDRRVEPASLCEVEISGDAARLSSRF